MNNKPVAWMDKDSGVVFTEVYGTIYNNLIPLYTHPAKTLTDDEIWKLWVKHLNDDIIVFARAILRKAQEK